ncbi:MAG TPA: dihydrolipoamide acetyltransferase family protein [Acidimicrobiales bacterium]|nr:dihydrolipoamide acetyltransferase family protein [Acidimicrobiales bacterium]
MADVVMPQLGETVTEGTVTRWMKAVGEQVERDEPLFEVSTDKVDSEVPSPAAGVLTEILVPEGETVEVGVKLAVIGDGAAGGDAPSAVETSPAAPPADPPAPPQPPAAPPPPRAAPPAAPSADPPAPPQPGVAEPPAPAPAPEAELPAASGADASEPLVLSPVVRKLLAESGITAAEVTATGVGGRITREDVLKVIDARHATPPPAAPAAPPSAAPAPPVSAPATPPAVAVASIPSGPMVGAQPAPAQSMASFRRAGDQVIPFSNMRRRTAEHMVRSKATSPHAFIANEVDFEGVERVRKAWGERFRAEEGFSLTYLPFIARSAVEALRDFPLLNASVLDDSLVVHAEVNLGIAVDLAHEGLIVPVIHRAEEVTLRGVARRIRDLAERARGRQLNADDISGGTFSITNDGPFGTFFTVPIINQPQVAILATDGIARRPVVVTQADGSESIAIHSTGILGVSWDHRAVDGAYVSSFLARVSELLGSRDWAAEL